MKNKIQTGYSIKRKTMPTTYSQSVIRNKWLSALLVLALTMTTTVMVSAQVTLPGTGSCSVLAFDGSGGCTGTILDAEYYQGASGDCTDPNSFTQQLANSTTTTDGATITEGTVSIGSYSRVTSAFAPSVAAPTALPNDKEILLQASGNPDDVYRFNVTVQQLERSDTSRVRIDVPNTSDTVIINVVGGGPQLVGTSGFGGGSAGGWTNNGVVSTPVDAAQWNSTPYNSNTQFMRSFFDHDPTKLIWNFAEATDQDYVQLGEQTSNIYGTYVAPCGDIQMKANGFEFLGSTISGGIFGWGVTTFTGTPFTGVIPGEAAEPINGSITGAVLHMDRDVVPSAEVELRDSSGALIGSEVTDASGNYTFANVPPADGYTVTLIENSVPVTDGPDADPHDKNPSNIAPVSVDVADGATANAPDLIIPEPEPSVDIIKTASSDTAEVGDVITYTYTVVNTGDLPLESIMVVDDKLGEIVMMLDNDLLGGGTLGTAGPIEIEAIGTATYVVQPSDVGSDGTGSITNVAIVTALSANGTEVSDMHTVTVSTDLLLGSIGDTIYHDENGNGMQDAGELGLGGVMVTITDSDGVERSEITAADGSYSFTNLPLDTYTVMVDEGTLPEGKTNAVNSGNPDGGNDGTSTAILTETAPDDDMQDFGYLSGSIGDTIYHDENGNGMQDAGELGLAGVEVTLTGANGTSTATTDENGYYLFTDLPLGDYTLTVNPDTLPADKQGADNTADPDSVLNSSASITLSSDPDTLTPDDLDQDFGYQLVGSIGDTIFHDENGNGVQDAGEPGLANVNVTVTGPNGSTTVPTDSNGMYMFTGLPMGDYTITVDLTSLPADKQGATNTADPDGGDTNMSSVTLSADGATDNPDQDFGYLLTIPTGSIGRFIYHDENQNGVQDAGEPGLSGVEVILSDANGNVLETANTSVDGSYLFDNLPVDTDYVVTVNTSTLPSDKQGAFNSGDPDGGNDATSAIGLPSDGIINNVDQNFGFFSEPLVGSVGDFVYSITRDGDEPLANVLLTLTHSNGMTYTTTTGADGMYLFEDIPLGDYTLELDESTLPIDKQGKPPAFVSDNGDDSVTTFTLTELVPDNMFQDFGYAKPTAVGMSSITAGSHSIVLMFTVAMLIGTAVTMTRRAED